MKKNAMIVIGPGVGTLPTYHGFQPVEDDEANHSFGFTAAKVSVTRDAEGKLLIRFEEA